MWWRRPWNRGLAFATRLGWQGLALDAEHLVQVARKEAGDDEAMHYDADSRIVGETWPTGEQVHTERLAADAGFYQVVAPDLEGRRVWHALEADDTA